MVGGMLCKSDKPSIIIIIINSIEGIKYYGNTNSQHIRGGEGGPASEAKPSGPPSRGEGSCANRLPGGPKPHKDIVSEAEDGGADDDGGRVPFS